MDIFEVRYGLRHLSVLVDTREQNTPALRKRLKDMGLPWERKKLEFGDYSIKCQLQNGGERDFSREICIERKMDLDELCLCYSKGRKRFSREFERAREAGAKIYLLVENGSWEKAYEGLYRSRMEPKAFTASLTAWLARYNCQLLFSSPALSGRLMADILYREAKERLEKEAELA